MPYRIHSQVDVEFWPVQVIPAQPAHVRDLLDARLREPWKLTERNEQHFGVEKKLKPV